MEALFLKILNMSIAAGWIALAVAAVRMVLKKAPKWISVLMWGLVGIRLACPFSLESIFSLIPSAETVPNHIMYMDSPAIQSKIAVFDSAVNPVISKSLSPDLGASVNPIQVITFIASIIWILGIAVMLIYAAVSSLNIYKKIKEAIPLKENILLCDHIASPFIFGIIHPQIYLPSAMNEEDMEYVIAHEKAHLIRRDHWWKLLGFLLLAIYWFHPILWISYMLLCRDIEFACDEKVIKNMEGKNKKQYSAALVNCSISRKIISVCPLAFGEVNVKARVKAVLNYKKPSFWIITAAMIAFVFIAVCFLTNPKKDNLSANNTVPMESEEAASSHTSDTVELTSYQQQLMDKYPEYFGLDSSNGLDVYVCQFAEEHYSFVLLPHTSAQRDLISPEFLNLPSTDANEMRHILAAYHIDESNINIIPWQNPLSSYIGEYWIISEGENTEEKQTYFIETVKNMLFGNGEWEETAIYDSMIFDVDGDGRDEYCVLVYGRTSGLFTFTFSAYETGSEQPKYSNGFCTPWYDLSFVRCEDGIIRVQGIDQEEIPQTHLFDISVIDGSIYLTEDGEDIRILF